MGLQRAWVARFLLAWFAWCSSTGATAIEKGLEAYKGPAKSRWVLKDVDGKAHRLDDYRGSVVIVNFWATWCAPCREEMPSLTRLRADFEGKPLIVLAVNFQESEAKVRMFLAELPLGFPVLLDADGVVSKGWGARILPMTFVLDANSRVRYRAVGELEWDSPAVKQRLAALLPRP